jgi:outer membrane receptor protein involved in Fe transport
MQLALPQDLVNDQLSTISIVNATPGNGAHATQIGLFGDDKLQVLRTLAVDLGVRYDIETVPRSAGHHVRLHGLRRILQHSRKHFGSRHFTPDSV